MTLEELSERIIAYRDAREWKQFHNPKDMAISMTLEATELLEHFQWKNKEEMEEHVKKYKEEVGEELADVLHCILIMCHDLNIDILKASENKMEKNELKYPVEKAKGKHTKYTNL